MKQSIHQKILRRLALGWLLLSLVIGGIVFYWEMEKVDDRVVEMALSESATFSTSFLTHSTQPDSARLLALREKTEEQIRNRFIAVELYDKNRTKIIETVRHGNDRFEAQINKLGRPFPLDNSVHYQKHYIDGELLLQVVAPLWDGQRQLVGYFGGVYQVDAATLQSIKDGVIRTLLLVVAVIFATTAMLYPIILSFNRGLIKLSSDLLKGNLELMEVLGSAVAKRDSDTHAHNYRVTVYAIRLAETVGLPSTRIRGLIAGAFLHDVGKIGVSDSILRKPGTLAEDELHLMRRHVPLGLDIISKSNWLQGAREVIEFHHEKFDGSGYARGLKGRQIPMTARIFAITDAFDALTSRRPHKEAHSFSEAMRIMQRDSGTHFDPELLDVFSGIVYNLYLEVSVADEKRVEEMLSQLVRKHFLTKQGS